MGSIIPAKKITQAPTSLLMAHSHPGYFFVLVILSSKGVDILCLKVYPPTAKIKMKDAEIMYDYLSFSAKTFSSTYQYEPDIHYICIRGTGYEEVFGLFKEMIRIVSV